MVIGTGGKPKVKLVARSHAYTYLQVGQPKLEWLESIEPNKLQAMTAA